jgi:hypothetical protein
MRHYQYVTTCALVAQQVEKANAGDPRQIMDNEREKVNTQTGVLKKSLLGAACASARKVSKRIRVSSNPEANNVLTFLQGTQWVGTKSLPL